MDIDERVKSLYKLSKVFSEDENLQEAISVIKFLRNSQGSLKAWNGRYREDNSQLKSEITQASQENTSLRQSLETLEQELRFLNQTVADLTTEKQAMLAHKDRLVRELHHIQTEVEVTAIKVRESKSLYGKFSLLWQLLKSLFLDEKFQDFGTIDNSVNFEKDKPGMNTDTASTQRSLLDE